MESLVHYSNPAHPLSVLGLLNEQRLRGQMCDVVLVVADQRYRAHKSVLAASSEYFQSLFTRMDDTSPKVVNLDFCEPDAFEIVLNYIYSSSLFVDKGSLSAIQELGYSLGIPFLTNIASTRPHASYCVSRKRLSFTEGDESDAQARSVIVCRVRNDTSAPCRANDQAKTPDRSSSSLLTGELAEPPSEHHNACQYDRNSEAISSKSAELCETSDRRSTYPYASILRGSPSHISSIRPQLKSSASFSDAEVQHIRLPSSSDRDETQETGEQEPHDSTKVSLQGHASELSQTIDRSGPLIKSLLRRSLSMDSPVPVFSPTLELKELQNHEQSLVKTSSESERTVHNGNARTSPLVLRSKYPSRRDEQTQVESREQSVKVEPSSPLADPLDIIRITVGEALPVNLKDLQTNYNQCSKASFAPFGKRKDRPDNRRYPFKKNKIFKPHPVSSDENASSAVSHSTSDDQENNMESLPNKIFTCWNCFKVFRSSAGLHRHVNMYHNPEKPYACDICHKRFHTNYKVWTHCQTQHGVLQNPASSSSSPGMDDRFQKKLIDIVREREIKKALLWKLKRNKQALQSPTLAKQRPRSSFTCPYCGKVFVFQSQYRQHLRTHPAEKADKDGAGEHILYREQDGVIQQGKDSESGVYACRLCNAKLPSLVEQGDHERGCRHSTVCPYCGLRFSTPVIKKDHEAHCKYKKLTCLECMRTFKSSFSIWRHQVEVHNNNHMTNIKEQMTLRQQELNEGMPGMLPEEHYTSEHLPTESSSYNDSSGTPLYDSEDSSSFVPEDLSMGHHGKLVVKEEPLEEAVSEREETEAGHAGPEEPGVWPCEKCGSLFSSRKDLERHQELLCHIKPFICHICNKAFRTNFRLWSHFQSHMSSASEPRAKETDRPSLPLSPSPPLASQNSERPSPQASVLTQVGDESSSPESSMSLVNNSKISQAELPPSSHSPLSRSESMENPGGAQNSDTLFYHAPSLSALAFKRQYVCKLCHRTFKTAFSLWSHEQSHGHV